MINKDDMNELPEEVRKLVEMAMKDGADVSVIRMNNKNKNNSKIDSILSKLDNTKEQEALDNLDKAHKEAIDVVPCNMFKDYVQNKVDTLTNDISKIDDDKVFELLNSSYMSVLKGTKRKPVLHILLTLSSSGKMNLHTVGIDSKEDLAKVFRELANQIENPDIDISTKNMGEL